jgi:hypothetical protein
MKHQGYTRFPYQKAAAKEKPKGAMQLAAKRSPTPYIEGGPQPITQQIDTSVQPASLKSAKFKRAVKV